jgi:RHS repeat-associated protein
MSSPQRPTYQYHYNGRGQMTKLIDANGHETVFRFNDDGLQTARVLPLGFGGDGKVGTFDDLMPLGPGVNWAPDHYIEAMEYDSKQRVTLSISFEGVHKRTVYDDDRPQGGGRVLREELFRNQANYDSYRNGGNFLGNLANGILWERVEHRYDAFGRVIESKHSYLNGSTNGVENATTNVDVWKWTYDPQGRIEMEESPTGKIRYTYDRFGRKASVESWAVVSRSPMIVYSPMVLSKVTYGYDDLGRLETVNTERRDGVLVDTSPVDGAQPETTEHFYDLLGRMDKSRLPNQLLEDYTFDSMDRLTMLAHYNGDVSDANLRDKFEYSYDPDLNPNTTTPSDGKRYGMKETIKFNASTSLTNEYEWSYDAAGRLIEEKLISTSDPTLSQTERYRYDRAGNRTGKSVDKTSTAAVDQVFTYIYDSNDLLNIEQLNNASTPDQSTAYTYNQTQQATKIVTQGPVNLTSQTFSYGLAGQLASVATVTRDSVDNLLSDKSVGYRYDLSGIRIIANDFNGGSPAGSVEYLIDHSNMTGYAQTIIETSRNASGQATQRISYTFGADEITQTTSRLNPGTGNVDQSDTFKFSHDGHGSTRVLFNATNAIAQAFVYTAFGELLTVRNAIGVQPALTAGQSLAQIASTNLLYNGESIDPRTGNYNFRARWYTPGSARFDRLDPFAGNPNDPFSFHKYAYAHGDPIGMNDPTGENAALAVYTQYAATVLGVLGRVGGALRASGFASTLGSGIASGEIGYGALTALGVLDAALLWQVVAGMGAAGALSSGVLTTAILAEIQELEEDIVGWAGSSSANVRAIAEFVRARAKGLAKEMADNLKRQGKRVFDRVFFDAEMLWPEPYAVDEDHLSRSPWHTLLNFQKRTQQERDTLMNEIATAENRPVQSGFDRHEFPFNSTSQARAGVSSMEYVNPAQNQLQGAVLNGFYQRNKFTTGSLFFVLLVPNDFPIDVE